MLPIRSSNAREFPVQEKAREDPRSACTSLSVSSIHHNINSLSSNSSPDVMRFSLKCSSSDDAADRTSDPLGDGLSGDKVSSCNNHKDRIRLPKEEEGGF